MMTDQTFTRHGEFSAVRPVDELLEFVECPRVGGKNDIVAHREAHYCHPLKTGHESFPSSNSLLATRVAVPEPETVHPVF